MALRHPRNLGSCYWHSVQTLEYARMGEVYQRVLRPRERRGTLVRGLIGTYLLGVQPRSSFP
jgi:hypothetical protein